MKRFNINEFLRLIILSGFAFYFFYILKTGKIYMFISPRMIIYTKCTLIFLSILSIYQLTKVFTVKLNQKINKVYIILILTLIICFLGLGNKVNSNLAEKKGINITSTQQSKNDKDDDESKDDEGNMVIADYNFVSKTDDIGANLEKYRGKKVVISGFVYKDNTLKLDEFVIARQLMTCCAADTSIVGLLCGYDNTSSLQKDQWVRIVGTIDSTQYKDSGSSKETTLALIKIETIENIKIPGNVYVYP